jgi:hypothetical protein
VLAGLGLAGGSLVAALLMPVVMYWGARATASVAAPAVAAAPAEVPAEEEALYELAEAAGVDVVQCEAPADLPDEQVEELASTLGFWMFTTEGSRITGAARSPEGTAPAPVPREVQIEIMGVTPRSDGTPSEEVELPTAEPKPELHVRTVTLKPLPEADEPPEPALPPEPEPEEEGTAEEELAPAGFGELLILSPNLFGEVWVDGVAHGPPPVVVKDLPAGSVAVEIRVRGQVHRAQQADVVADSREKVMIR